MTVPEEVKTYDISGMTVLPGLIDSHVHLKRWHNRKKCTRYGITTLKSVGDLYGVGLQYGNSLHRELQLLVDAGLSPKEAIQAATHHAARLLQKEDELGTIETEKLADISIVEGDPLENIQHTKPVRMTIRNGTVVRDTRN